MDCCAPYHLGRTAPTAEALMRSRYSAFVLGFEPYLLQTWHSDTRPKSLNLTENSPAKWLGLEVKTATLINKNNATVEFFAHYEVDNTPYHMHEISQFSLIDGLWFYKDGIDLTVSK